MLKGYGFDAGYAKSVKESEWIEHIKKENPLLADLDLKAEYAALTGKKVDEKKENDVKEK